MHTQKHTYINTHTHTHTHPSITRTSHHTVWYLVLPRGRTTFTFTKGMLKMQKGPGIQSRRSGSRENNTSAKSVLFRLLIPPPPPPPQTRPSPLLLLMLQSGSLTVYCFGAWSSPGILVPVFPSLCLAPNAISRLITRACSVCCRSRDGGVKLASLACVCVCVCR